MNKVGDLLGSLISPGLKEPDLTLTALHVIVQLGHYSLADTVFKSDRDRDSFLEAIEKQEVSKVFNSQQSEMIVYYHQLFALLSIAGKQKHSLAPVLFKTLLTKYK